MRVTHLMLLWIWRKGGGGGWQRGRGWVVGMGSGGRSGEKRKNSWLLVWKQKMAK